MHESPSLKLPELCIPDLTNVETSDVFFRGIVNHNEINKSNVRRRRKYPWNNNVRDKANENKDDSDSDYNEDDSDPDTKKVDINGYYNVSPNDHIAWRYQIIGKVGHGSFAHVYEVFDHKVRQKMALKIQRISKDPSSVRYPNKEVGILAYLADCANNEKDDDIRKGSDHVMKFLDVFDFHGHLCITTRLFSQSLYATIYRAICPNISWFTEAAFKRVTRHLLQALAFLKKYGIVHGDIKPDNIMLQIEDCRAEDLGINAMLIDFGFAHAVDEYSNGWLGAPQYQAPEALLFNTMPGYPMDMWSVGCILFEMLASETLFPYPENYHVKDKIVEKMLSKLRLKKTPEDGQYVILTETLKTLLEDHDDNNDLMLFLECTLQFDPELRMTPEEGLQNSWIVY